MSVWLWLVEGGTSAALGLAFLGRKSNAGKRGSVGADATVSEGHDLVVTHLAEDCNPQCFGIATWEALPDGALVQIGSGSTAEVHQVTDVYLSAFAVVAHFADFVTHSHRLGEPVYVLPQRELNMLGKCPGCGLEAVHLLGQRHPTLLVDTIDRECQSCGRTWAEVT